MYPQKQPEWAPPTKKVGWSRSAQLPINKQGCDTTTSLTVVEFPLQFCPHRSRCGIFVGVAAPGYPLCEQPTFSPCEAFRLLVNAFVRFSQKAGRGARKLCSVSRNRGVPVTIVLLLEHFCVFREHVPLTLRKNTWDQRRRHTSSNENDLFTHELSDLPTKQQSITKKRTKTALRKCTNTYGIGCRGSSQGKRSFETESRGCPWLPWFQQARQIKAPGTTRYLAEPRKA